MVFPAVPVVPVDAVCLAVFLFDLQNNCSKSEYFRVKSGINGGFSAQFQLLASKFMVALAAGNYEVPVLITGPLNGYSAAPECKDANYEWLCYFQPSSVCHEQLLQSGRELRIPNSPSFEESVPLQFKEHGPAFWWGIVQQYLFHLEPFLHEYIHKQNNHGFSGIPMVGIHVRHGDKKFDGFTTHSLSEELSILRASPLCAIQSHPQQACFLSLQYDPRQHSLYVVTVYKNVTLTVAPYLRSAAASVTVLRRSDINHYNHSSINASIPRWDLRQVQHAIELHYNGSGKNRYNHKTLVAPVDTNQTRLWDHLLRHELVVPLPVFVASDDMHVLETARQHHGFMVGSMGVSQSVAERVGMLHTLLKQPAMSFNATKEIIADIVHLARCQALIGSASSQVFRLAVALANVSHGFWEAKIIDKDDVPRVRAMSAKYHIPFLEDFQ